VFIESNDKGAYCAHEDARNARDVEDIDAFVEKCGDRLVPSSSP